MVPGLLNFTDLPAFRADAAGQFVEHVVGVLFGVLPKQGGRSWCSQFSAHIFLLVEFVDFPTASLFGRTCGSVLILASTGRKGFSQDKDVRSPGPRGDKLAALQNSAPSMGLTPAKPD